MNNLTWTIVGIKPKEATIFSFWNVYGERIKKFTRKKTLEIICVYKNSQGKPIIIVIQIVICFFTANMKSFISVTESLPNILKNQSSSKTSLVVTNVSSGYILA